ncbi:MAG: endonuclease Q family protein, partial [candidate division KSB1 bacterium]|nr:endonuclease Q family protein [candidate division KSB1 bacterium]
MIITADLHIHSYLSRATSSQLNLEHLNQWAQIKGLQVVATGDFTHPKWLAELKQKLEPAEEGLYRLKDEFAAQTQREVFGACRGEVRFMLSTEISNIYKKKGQVRKIHNVVFVPDFESAEKLQEALAKIGNLAADGRPILGLDSRALLELVLEVHPQAFLVPAHIWTPWFSILGSQSGFDSIEECFDDLTPHIFALETGLSSDPAMNWRLSHLDRFALISNSDAHSPAKLAREANVFNTELSYPAILEALKTKNPERFLGTIEFFPEEGKYHYDGHRKCGTRMAPRETLAYNGLCPVCGRPVTVGVMHRVESLADRKEGEKPPGALPFRSLIPLPEIIAEVQDVGVTAKSVDKVFSTLLSKLGPELEILQHVPLEEIEHLGGPILSEAIRRVREGKVQIAAGYDGEYGSIRLFNPEERKKFLSQMVFFQPAPTKSGQIPSKSGQAVPALEKPTPAKIKDYSAEAE